MLLAIVVELTVMASLLLAGSGTSRFWALALLSVALSVYHRLASAFGMPCNCAGAWTINSALAAPNVTHLLLLLLQGSAGTGLAAEWWEGRGRAPGARNRRPELASPGKDRAPMAGGRPHLSAVRRWLSSCLLIAGLDRAPQALAFSYVAITAEIELTSYASRDTNGVPLVKHRSYSANCVVGTNAWRVETTFLKTASDVWYFDGTNVYERTQMTAPTEGPPILLFETVPFEQAKSLVTVRVRRSTGGLPVGNVGVNLPWLAFCSGPYLRQRDRVVPLPTTDQAIAPNAFVYADRTRVFPDPLGLPSSLLLFTSGHRAEEGLRDGRLQRTTSVLRILLAPGRKLRVADGLPTFRYQVDDATNFAGWTFPLAFQFSEDEPDRNGKWQHYAAGKGRLTSIQTTEELPSVLTPGTRATIIDFRFRQPDRLMDDLVYEVTNLATLPGTNAAWLQAKLGVARRRALRDPLVTARPLRWVVALAAGASMIVAARVLLRSRQFREASPLRPNLLNNNNKQHL